MGQIFISYSRRDKGFVDQLVQDLGKNGFEVWIDWEDIVGGESWRAFQPTSSAGLHSSLLARNFSGLVSAI
jgi:hypothetical protein